MLLAMEMRVAINSSDSYKTGFEAFKENKPDVVLLGISLQEENSMELLSKIKTFDRTIPVIVLSLNINDNIHEQCLGLGADFLLDKYYEFEKIPEVINSIAGNNSK